MNRTNKGIEVEFTNHSNNTIRWVEQNPKNIPNAIESAKGSSNAGKAVEGKVADFVQTDVGREELATVGLKFNKEGVITENDLRAQFGLNLRGAYTRP